MEATFLLEGSFSIEPFPQVKQIPFLNQTKPEVKARAAFYSCRLLLSHYGKIFYLLNRVTTVNTQKNSGWVTRT